MPSFTFIATALLGALAVGTSAAPAPELVERGYSFAIPASKGSVTYKKTQVISGTFDGGMKTYGRGVKCTGQAEGGDSDTVFQLENGATLKNLIIGADQIEGVHCKGSCTIESTFSHLTFHQGTHANESQTSGGLRSARMLLLSRAPEPP
jgi:hypothetical protein